MRLNLPAEPEAEGIVVITCCRVVESLNELLEYIGRFWFSERVGWTCSRHWFVILLRWREFDKSVVEGEHAMEHSGFRKQNNKWWRVSVCVPRFGKLRKRPICNAESVDVRDLSWKPWESTTWHVCSHKYFFIKCPIIDYG